MMLREGDVPVVSVGARAAPSAAPPLPRALLAVTGASGFLVFLDATVVNVAFPEIAASFPAATRAELSWVLTAYAIVFAALLVPGGRLGDAIGQRRCFLIGAALFTFASAVCAAAPSVALLIVARVAQAAGGALVVPASQTLLMSAVPAERRGAAVSIWAAAAALAAAVGPPLGGLLVDIAGWRSVFLVNLPIGIATLVLGRSVLTEQRAPAQPLDALGALLAATSMAALALAIVEGGAWGWTSPAVLSAFAAALLLGSVLVARCVRRPGAIVDLTLFRIRSFAAGAASTLLFGVAFFATLLGASLFLTQVWAYSVLDAGLAIAPMPLAGAVAAAVSGRHVDRGRGRGVALAGALSFAAGALWMRGALGLTPAFVTEWLPGAVLLGAGIGLGYATATTLTVADVEPRRFGLASGLSGMTRQFGAVLGVALLVAVLGTPAPQDALAAFDAGWLLVALAAAAAGIATLAFPAGRPAAPTR